MLREHFVKRDIIRIKIYSKNTLKVASNDSCSFPLQLGSSTRAHCSPGSPGAYCSFRRKPMPISESSEFVRKIYDRPRKP